MYSIRLPFEKLELRGHKSPYIYYKSFYYNPFIIKVLNNFDSRYNNNLYNVWDT